MNTKSTITLEDMANELCHSAAVEFGLHREPECDEDLFAEKLAVEVLNLIKDRIGAEFIRIGEKRLAA